jgi:hypothetical protein
MDLCEDCIPVSPFLLWSARLLILSVPVFLAYWAGRRMGFAAKKAIAVGLLATILALQLFLWSSLLFLATTEPHHVWHPFRWRNLLGVRTGLHVTVALGTLIGLIALFRHRTPK